MAFSGCFFIAVFLALDSLSHLSGSNSYLVNLKTSRMQGFIQRCTSSTYVNGNVEMWRRVKTTGSVRLGLGRTYTRGRWRKDEVPSKPYHSIDGDSTE